MEHRVVEKDLKDRLIFQPQHSCPIQRLLRNGAGDDPRLEVAVGDSDRMTPPAQPHCPQG